MLDFRLRMRRSSPSPSRKRSNSVNPWERVPVSSSYVSPLDPGHVTGRISKKARQHSFVTVSRLKRGRGAVAAVGGAPIAKREALGSYLGRAEALGSYLVICRLGRSLAALEYSWGPPKAECMIVAMECSGARTVELIFTLHASQMP
jgi:hypothetical protein